QDVAVARVLLPGDVSRQQQHRDLLLGQLLGDRLEAAYRPRVLAPDLGGDLVADVPGGGGGDLVEGGADGRPHVVVAAAAGAPSVEGDDRPERPGQVRAGSVEDVLVARAEHDVRADPGGGVVNPGGDLRSIRLAAAFRLAVGQVPLAVVHGRRLLPDGGALGGPALADQEGLGRDLGAAGVRDHVGAIAVGDHDHAGGAGGRGRGRPPAGGGGAHDGR